MYLRNLTFVFVCIYLHIINISCENKSTLAFAIDDSRSMWREIEQLKSVIKDIVRTTTPNKIKDYVLVTINDPDVVLRIQTNSIASFEESVNSLLVHNYLNADCEEMTISGVEMALRVSQPGSYIYVFTDASAKDYQKAETIISLCEQKQAKVLFVLTGDCGSRTVPQYMVYQEIAASCSGHVFQVPKNQFSTVSQLLTTPGAVLAKVQGDKPK